MHLPDEKNRLKPSGPSLLPGLLAAATVVFLPLLHSLAATGPPLFGENEIHPAITTNFYSISGESFPELRRQLNLLGYRTPEGKRVDAYTSWHMHWNYKSDSKSNGVFVSSATVSLEVTLTLPHFIPSASTPYALTNDWAKYVAALMVHESGHANIAAHHAERLYLKLNTKKSFTTHQELRRFVDGEGKKSVTEANTENAKYDKQTLHGAMQGARWHG